MKATGDPKPLDITDGRIPCPVCGTLADLTGETLITHIAGQPRQVRAIWECPWCAERFSSIAKSRRRHEGR